MRWGVNIDIKLAKADIAKFIVLNRLPRNRETYLREEIDSRMVFFEIEGTIRDLTEGLGQYDLIAFRKTSDESFEDAKIVHDIKIRIDLQKNRDLELNERPSFYLDGSTMVVSGLYFGVDDFNHIEAVLNDKFVRIRFSLYRGLSRGEIEQNQDNPSDLPTEEFIDLDHQTLTQVIDEEKKRVLSVEGHENNIVINHFRIYSSKPKYIKKEEWLDDIWSVEDKLDRDIFDKEDNLLDQIDKERNNFPKHTFNELRKINSLTYVVIILLIILAFKV